MILQVLTIRDVVADAFDRPSFHTSVGGAVRAFGDECVRADSPIKAHPDHYELYHLGTYDDSSGSFDLLPRPKQVAVGGDYGKS